MNEKIKDCPFCGSPYIQLRVSDISDTITIECEECEIVVIADNTSADSLDKLIKKWNRRI